MLTQSQIQKIKEILIQNGIPYAGVFGSYAKGLQNEKSDIDILIKFYGKPSISIFDMVRVERELSQALDKEVDLVTPNSLSKYFRDDVLKSVVEIYDQGHN
jgi:predicted nucleotidyltransferase